MTSQETYPPQSDEPDVPDTEVILVPAPAPVFVDSTGRRRRLLRRASYGFGAFCVVYGGLVSVSLAGGPVSPQAFLPFPDLADGPTATSPSARPQPAPTVASGLGSSASPSVAPGRVVAAPPDRPRSPGAAAPSARAGGPVLEGTRRPSASPSPSASVSPSASAGGSPPPTSAPPSSAAPAPGGGGGGTGTGWDEGPKTPDDDAATPCPVTPPKVTLTVIGLVGDEKDAAKAEKKAAKKADKKAAKKAAKGAAKAGAATEAAKAGAGKAAAKAGAGKAAAQDAVDGVQSEQDEA